MICPIPPSFPGERCRGFTLLEVLISLALFGIALSLLIGGFRYTTRAWEKSEEYSTDTANLQAVHRVFKNTLGRAFPVTVNEGTDNLYAFEGSENRVRFATFLPPYPDQAGLYEVRFDIHRKKGLYQLTMSREAFSEEAFRRDENIPEAGTTVLLETVQPPAFSFFGSPDAVQSPDWHPAWDSDTQYPSLVRLTLPNGDTGQPVWPEIVTEIEINIDSACIFPTSTGKCRLTN